jgi:predicted metal-dependent hydrolase
MKYLTGYPESLLAQVRQLMAQQRLGEMLRQRYPQQRHEVRSDRALFDYVQALKAEYLRSSEPVNKACFDNKLHVIRHALGTHTTVSRVQGSKLKAKREIRIAALFRETPPEFLKMIVVHELAHLRVKDHDKSFYQLCSHMEPNYAQYEFDLRLYLTYLESDEHADRPSAALD